MRVVVSSTNPVKLAATRDAFSTCFKSAEIDLISVRVSSGVPDQPMSDDETRHGAEFRAAEARSEHEDAEFWLGIEGGIEVVAGQFLASAWMVVLDPNGKRGMSRTPSLPLPPRIKLLVESGLELGDANDQVFSTYNSKQAGGAFGLLSEGRYTRRSIYAQTITIALIPFLHPLFKDGTS